MKRLPHPSSKPTTFDGYLDVLPDDQRAALEKLRRTIRTAAPVLEECISYGLPTFRLHGKFLVAIGAAAKHCAFYVGSTLRAHRVDLHGYDTSTGTIRFDPRHPLPAVLIRKLVKSRIAQQSRLNKEPARAKPRQQRARKVA